MFKFIYLYILLIRFDTGLSKHGFSKYFERCAKKYYRHETVSHCSEEKAQEIVKLFSLLNIVCTWYPRKADCILKTMIGYKILREKYELPVDMVIGVRKFPFEAHAWLMMGNNDFFEEGVETSSFKIVLNSKKYIGND